MARTARRRSSHVARAASWAREEWVGKRESEAACREWKQRQGATHLQEVIARLGRLVHVQPGSAASRSRHQGVVSCWADLPTAGRVEKQGTDSTEKFPTLVSTSTTGAAMDVSVINPHTAGAYVAMETGDGREHGACEKGAKMQLVQAR